MNVNDFEKLKLKKFKMKSILPDATILILGKRRSGKCFKKGTKVLTFDMSLKNVEDIEVGDLLMGPDSKKRTVLETHNDKDTLYKVKLENQDTFIVNSQHILCMFYNYPKRIHCDNNDSNYEVSFFNKTQMNIVKTLFPFNKATQETSKEHAFEYFNSIKDDLYIDISVEDYISLSAFHKEYLLMYYSNAIELPEQTTEIKPYDYGIQIGNNLTTEIINNSYIKNSIKNREDLLQGIIDSCGEIYNDATYFQIPKKNNQLQQDCIFLCRSLGINPILEKSKSKRGYTCIKLEYTEKSKCKFAVTKSKKDSYYGFEVDSDHKFLLSSFLVVHNSFLTRDIFYNHRNIPTGVVFSGTEEASPFFGDFIPDSFIHSEYSPELIDSMMMKQKKKIREAKDKGLSDNGKHPSNNVFIVLDDMLHEAQTWKKDKTIKSIFFNGRHYNFLFILTMQYAQGIPPELRSNIDYIFIFAESSVANRKRIYEAYAGMIPSFDYFCNILDACTTNHECLVIKTSGNTNDLRDQIFWYKAESHKDFRVGHPKVWEYHDTNYNKNYEQDGEQDQEELNKLRKKFAKTKKLKVIVSRQGDIVGYNQE